MVANANTNTRRAPTREEYERDQERYNREARESGRTIGAGANDGWLWVKTRFELAATDELRDTRINVDVENGVITLDGIVVTQEQHAKALDTVKNIEGVKGVKDHLIVSSISPSPTPLVTPSLMPTPSASSMPTATIPKPSPVYGTPSPTPTPSTPMARIDQILASMEFGEISFNVPPSMSLHDTQTVTLLLSLKQTSEQLAQQLKNEGAVGDIKEARIKVHDKMQAVISGDGFQITPWLTTDTLPVSKEQTTEWKWDVRAQRPGTLHLLVVLHAIVDVDDGSGPRPYPIKTFSHTYVVQVPWRDGVVATFIKNNWTWLWTALILPVAAWIWNRNRKKRGGPAGFKPQKPRQ